MLSLDEIFPKDYPDFSEHGAPPCSVAPDLFIPANRENAVTGKLGGSYYTNEYEAKTLCSQCPYKTACLEFALKSPQMGIWGGTNESERKRMVRQKIINYRVV